ncbi:DgyrCDS12155 [Dimorphilus gyrociliatus]|uniref:DgyrCDS12155 n=1 Tax=Dimorphilus gyrociliatus TaxID=2664684 RepID=A0A7I8W5K7_9ANNE|nr:DgyrCDS12155 [Dimorphilus gyrociliatus]
MAENTTNSDDLYKTASSHKMAQTKDILLDVINNTMKEPLEFGPVPSDSIARKIKDDAEAKLFHWSSFDMKPPDSITDTYEDIYTTAFIMPNFNELRQVAVDESGSAKPLSEEQLTSIRREGTFKVKSINFPQYFHKWKLSKFLQKGTQLVMEDFYDGLAKALYLFIVLAKRMLLSRRSLSLYNSVKNLTKAFLGLIDVLVGIPWKQPKYSVHTQVEEENTKFLSAELKYKNEEMEKFENLCAFVERQELKFLENMSKRVAEQDINVNVVYPVKFTTPDNSIDIDLTLRSISEIDLWQTIKKRIVVISKSIANDRTWYIPLRKKLIEDNQDLYSEEELKTIVLKGIQDQYVERLINNLLDENSPDYEIHKLLVDHLRANLIITQIIQNITDTLDKNLKQYKKELFAKHPIKSRISSWIREKTDKHKENFYEENKWPTYEKCVTELKRNNLNQSAYFLQRDYIFKKTRKEIISQEFTKSQPWEPERTFYINKKIWNPQNYIVYKYNQESEQREVVETIIEASPITMKPTKNSSHPKKKSYEYFSTEKSQNCKIHTKYPFWRLWLILARICIHMSNCFFYFGIAIPFFSPVSITALVLWKKFYPKWVLNGETGTLKRDSSPTQTLMSRMFKLWRHVFRSVENFELQDDTAFIEKNVQRPFNRIWNYGIKGALGTFLLFLTVPLICILSTLGSLILAIFVPLWVPVLTVLWHFFCVAIYDIDHPNRHVAFYKKLSYFFLNIIIWRLLLRGICQILLIILSVTVFFPFASLCIILWYSFQFCIRTVWDASLFYLMIKWRGRIPSSNSWIAKRISGPGLVSNFFYQIKPEQVLMGVESFLEKVELNIWRDNVRKVIDIPLQAYRNYFGDLLAPFDCSIKESPNGVYSFIRKENRDLHSKLDSIYREQQSKLSVMNSSMNIRLPVKELTIAVDASSRLIEQFVESRIYKLLNTSEEIDSYWKKWSLIQNDWPGLTMGILKTVFGSEISIPLEKSDEFFQLEVQELNVARYVNMLESGDWKEDMQTIGHLYSQRHDVISECVPVTLPESIFDVRDTIASQTWSKSLIELPVKTPHPAYVSLLLCQR